MGTNGKRTGNSHIREISRAQGRELLNRQTRLHLNMSAQEFIKAWHEGKFRDERENPEVARLGMMIPLAD